MKKPKAKKNKAKDVERINLNAMSVIELKALAYDIFAQIQQGQKDLVQVNNVIAEKTNGKATGRSRTPEPEIKTEIENSEQAN